MGSRKRAALLAASAAAGALALMAQPASASIFAPDSAASDSASSARTLYVVMAIIGVIAIVGILAALGRALRSKRSGEEAERRTRATSGLELRVGIGLGAVALVLFVVGIIFTVQTNEVDAADGAEPITIKVDAQQWLWRYAYPPPEESPDGFVSDQPYSYQRLVVPVDTPITLEVSSVDVMHRWSVPALAPAVDAVPGATNEVSFKANDTGTYDGASMRFSGSGYATMRTVVEVVEQAEYEQFLEDKIAGIEGARSAVQQRVDEGTAPGVEFEE